MTQGRKPIIGKRIIESAQFNRTVADIVQETGAKPNTVRKVLRDAETRGVFVIRRLYKGRGNRRIEVESVTSVTTALNALVFGWSGKVSK